MHVLILKMKLKVSWCHSLKEKRMVVRSIIQRLKNKFNVSVSEVEEQDIHQIVVIGITVVSSDGKQIDSIKENIINFVEEDTEPELIDIEYDSFAF